MSALIQIVNLLINIFGSIYLSIIILRFILQTSRADFYNPISQAIVKLTNPVLIPLRKVIPGLWGIDFATVIFAILFHALVMQLVILINVQQLVGLHYLFLWSLVGITLNTLTLYTVAGFILVIASFLAPYSRHPALVLVHQIMAPLTDPIRKYIPPVGGLDFSLFFVFILLMIIKILVSNVAASFHTPMQFLIGYSF